MEYSDSVVVPQSYFKMIFSKTFGPVVTSLQDLRELKIVNMVLASRLAWPPRPSMVETFQSSPESLDSWP